MGVFSSKVADTSEVFVEAPLAPKEEDLVWHDCIETHERKPIAKAPSKRTSQLVADRLSWMQEKLLSPSSNHQNETSNPRTSALVAERKKLLELQRQQNQKRQDIPPASKELVAERLHFLEEQLRNSNGKETKEEYQARSSELVAERAKFLEAWSTKVMQSPSSLANVVTSELTLDERKKLLEAQRQQSNQVSKTPDVTITSELVTQRAKWLEQRQWEVDTQTSTSRMDSSLLEGVACERSKWLQWWSTGGKASDINTREATRQSRPGKLDPSRLIPTSTTGSGLKAKNAAEAAVFGSLAEKRARFSGKDNNANTNANANVNNTLPRRGKLQRWGENYMPHVEEMVEQSGFLSHVMVEVEQEGLLPNFLAEHTSWWLGGSTNDETGKKPGHAKDMDLLRLDYQPPTMEQLPVSNQEPQSSVQQEPQVEESHVNGETSQDKDDEVYLDPIPTLSSTEEASESGGQGEVESAMANDENDTGDLEEDQGDDFFLDKTKKPWSQMSYEECRGQRKEIVCSFCEIL